MKYLLMLLAVGLAGCITEIDSATQEVVAVEKEVPQPPVDEYDRYVDWDLCPNTVEIIKLSDGSHAVIIPGLCDLRYRDQGDPPDEEEVNLQQEIKQVDLVESKSQ